MYLKIIFNKLIYLTTVGKTSAENTWAAAQPPAIPDRPNMARVVVSAGIVFSFPVWEKHLIKLKYIKSLQVYVVHRFMTTFNEIEICSTGWLN